MEAKKLRLSAEEIANRLDRPQRTRGGWLACCPAHDDASPSLSIGEGDAGQLLLHCFAGCRFEEIEAALGILPESPVAPPAPPAPAPRKPKLKRRARPDRPPVDWESTGGPARILPPATSRVYATPRAVFSLLDRKPRSMGHNSAH